MFKIIFTIIAIISIYVSIVSYYRSPTSKSKRQGIKPHAPQHMLVQNISNPQYMSLLSQGKINQTLLLSSNTPYVDLIKKIIGQNFKGIDPITNIIIKNLEKIFPEAWHSGIFGFIYLIFNFVFGGIFGKNTKELSNHQAKIERGITFKFKFQAKSMELMNQKKHLSLQELNFKHFDSLVDFLNKEIKQVKIIQSSKRQDISYIVSTYLRAKQSHKNKNSYLNLQTIPFNHQSNNNLHVHILNDITYGILFNKDRVALSFPQNVIEKVKAYIRSINLTKWFNLNSLFFMLGVYVGFMFNPQIAILFAVLKTLLFLLQQIYSLLPKNKQQLVSSHQYLILDKFQLILQELINKNDAVIQNNMLVFTQIIGNIINIVKTTNFQIIIIIQEPLFYEQIIKKVCSLSNLKYFTSYHVEQFNFSDASYISKYLNIDFPTIKRKLQWSNDLNQISQAINQHSNQLQIFKNTLQANIHRIEQIIIDNPKLKEQTNLFLQFALKEKISQLRNNQQRKILQISQQLIYYLRGHITKLYQKIEKEKVDEYLHELMLIIQNYSANEYRFISFRQRYISYKQRMNKNEGQYLESNYKQIYNLLNKQQILYYNQFFSKSVCISAYLWSNKLL